MNKDLRFEKFDELIWLNYHRQTSQILSEAFLVQY